MTGLLIKELIARSDLERCLVVAPGKAEYRMGRNHLAHYQGDAVNAVLAAAGYNFRLLIKWLRLLLRQFIIAILAAPIPLNQLKSA